VINRNYLASTQSNKPRNYSRYDVFNYSEAVRHSDYRLKGQPRAKESLLLSPTRQNQLSITNKKSPSPECISHRTDGSMKSEISKILREKAMEAYMKEKASSIFDEQDSTEIVVP
jgi:hypothetical protein